MAALNTASRSAIRLHRQRHTTASSFRTWVRTRAVIDEVHHADLEAAIASFPDLYIHAYGPESFHAQWARTFCDSFSSAIGSALDDRLPVADVCDTFDREWSRLCCSFDAHIATVFSAAGSLHSTLPRGRTTMLEKPPLWDASPRSRAVCPLSVANAAVTSATVLSVHHRASTMPVSASTTRSTLAPAATSDTAPRRPTVTTRTSDAKRLADRHAPGGSLHSLHDGRVMDEAIMSLHLPHAEQPCLRHLLNGPSQCTDTSSGHRLHLATAGEVKAYLKRKGANI